MKIFSVTTLPQNENEKFCQYIASRFRLSVLPFPLLSDERINAQRNIQKEIDEWMSFKKMSERQILEFYKRLSWILKI